MLFRRNKISEQMKEAANSEKVASSDFESLDIVSQRRKQNRLFNRLIVQQYKDGKENVKEKYHSSISFVKTKWPYILKTLMFIFLIASFVLSSWLLFSPFWPNTLSNFGYSGNVPTPINNFYTAKVSDGNITYSLSILGITSIVLFGLFLICFLIWFVWAIKNKKIVSAKTRATKIISYVIYVLIAIGILLVFVGTLIPPTISSLTSNGQENLTLINKINFLLNKVNDSAAEAEANELIKKLFDLNNISIDSSLSLATNFNNHLTDFLPSYKIDEGFSLFNSFGAGESSLSLAGYLFLCFSSVFFGIGLIILPFVIEVLKIKKDLEININVRDEMNVFRSIIANFITREKMWIFRKIKAFRNRDTFKKYKKEINEQGVSLKAQKETFKSDEVNNERTQVITKQEIESHPANKAFLNNQGQWMYHDGEGKYFIVKNDEWVPFDINQAIHQAHVNISALNRDTDIGNKQAKERRFFKNNKIVDDISAKTSKNKAKIDLPDDDLNKILSELDI